MKKKLLFIINTMGRAGAETALIALLKRLDSMNEYDLFLLSIIPCGEMYDYVPPSVHLLNKKVCHHSLNSFKGRMQICITLIQSFFYQLNGFRMLEYLIKNWKEQKERGGKLQYDKLFWRLMANRFPTQKETFDLAISYIEGASTYYLSDKVIANSKAAFIHIDYESSGYTPFMDQSCYDNINRIYVVSNEVGVKFLKVYPDFKDKIRLFRNLLDRDRILKMADVEPAFTDSFAGVRLVTVGRLHYQKGYDIAIESLSMLRSAGYNVKWYVIGDGMERSNLELLIKKNKVEDSFILLGSKDNPYPYIKHADIYVQATRFEGKSIAVEEAQILGKVILASNCTGNSEQIQSGYDGLLITLNVNNLVNSLIRLINDSYLRSQFSKHVLEKKLDYPEDLDDLLSLL